MILYKYFKTNLYHYTYPISYFINLILSNNIIYLQII